MRPRPDAAENENKAFRWRERYGASMRPRPDAAENACVLVLAARQGGMLQ